MKLILMTAMESIVTMECVWMKLVISGASVRPGLLEISARSMVSDHTILAVSFP